MPKRYYLHVTKAETFYKDLNEKTKLARQDPSIEVISFDFQQNMPLPVAPGGDVFYKIQLWVYNFCIHVGSSKKSYFYVYDETVGGKGQNEVISFLNHFLNNFIRPEIKHVYIYSDNCSSQNKNNVLVQFLFTIVKLGKFATIIHRFPEPGHSFLPCDRCFGAIEKKKKVHDRIYLLEEYHKIIREAGKNFVVIKVTQELILNFKGHFSTKFRKTVSTKKDPFTISKYRIFKYDSQEMPKILCSESVALPTYASFQILKKDESPSLPNDNETLYSKKRILKSLKFKHVMDLAKEYVPRSDMWFYNTIEEEQLKAQGEEAPGNENSDISEYDDTE